MKKFMLLNDVKLNSFHIDKSPQSFPANFHFFLFILVARESFIVNEFSLGRLLCVVECLGERGKQNPLESRRVNGGSDIKKSF